MNITFYIHSQTGNSLSVADALAAAAAASGNTSELSRITPDDESQMDLNMFTILPLADCSQAGLIVVGGPVRGFSASPAVLKALSLMGDLTGKKAVLYVTQALPFDWMGGKRAVKQIEQALAAKGAQVVCKADIHWKSKNRQTRIDELTETFRQILT